MIDRTDETVLKISMTTSNYELKDSCQSKLGASTETLPRLELSRASGSRVFQLIAAYKSIGS
jgi:hypothetical protein